MTGGRRYQPDKNKAAGNDPAACSSKTGEGLQKETIWPIRKDWPWNRLFCLLKLA
jgi:hypothetical protein